MKIRFCFFVCSLFILSNLAQLVALEKKHRMSQQSAVVPVAEKKTDSAGKVKFEIEAGEEKVFYRLNAMTQDQVVGSNPLRPKAGETVHFHIRIPKTIEGMAGLLFHRNILIFDVLADAVRVTEIINLENPTQNSVDIRKDPFIKSVPADLFNFQVLEGKSGFDIQLNQRKITFSLIVPPGRHQLFYSYHLPVKSGLRFNHSLPPNTKEVELIVPGNTLDVSFESTRETIVKSMKQSNNRVYASQLLKLDSPRQSVGIQIKNLPMSQKQLFYPAIMLGIILLFGLFIFLNGRNKKQA